MRELLEQHVSCPYCGEPISVLIDNSEESQQYIEDCQVCCQPIVFQVDVAMNGDTHVMLYREDDTY